MSSVVINGDTSGSITLQAPAVAGTNTLTLPANTGTVVLDSSTQTLTNKTLTSPTITGAVMSSMASSVITSKTAVASTSGTSIDFTGIPSWVKRITVLLNGVSTNGISPIRMQLGVSGTPETSGYLGTVGTMVSGAVGQNNFTAGFEFYQTSSATNVFHGQITFSLLTGNTWVASGVWGNSDTARVSMLGGSKTLAGTLNMVRITTNNGTDTFDAGSINILYE